MADPRSGTAAAFLGLYPPTLTASPEDGVSSRNARLQKALDYVHAHADQPISVADIAAAAGLSVRSIQETFQRTLGQTPMAYLHHVRLTAVRQELLQNNRSTTTVGAVARKWGFGHLGRFSSSYYATFGEHPRHTLRSIDGPRAKRS
ncbi:helix-turn-helix transcriptional regulator [Curtobacterium sp. ISL-83]|uniref:helix-turn-helix transcriptional regulator n=1 Tax=Curtobacterium sp. ISL-83 TaxID=2819145 RepID=UPI001BED27A5|nr:helix-turn-helix transcriptional regulator [Curtobacterium sp. ISL-83]